MAWCNHCLSNHDGPCLDERMRHDVMGALDGLLGSEARTCPTCGVEEPFCPVQTSVKFGQAPASRSVRRRCPLRANHHTT
jgi:hypothetical protein